LAYVLTSRATLRAMNAGSLRSSFKHTYYLTNVSELIRVCYSRSLWSTFDQLLLTCSADHITRTWQIVGHCQQNYVWNIKYVLPTVGVGKESISKILIGNRFHVKLRILSPENCQQHYGEKLKS